MNIQTASGVFLGNTGPAFMAMLVSVNKSCLSVMPGMVTMGTGMSLAVAPSPGSITSALLEAVLTAGDSNAIGLHLQSVPSDRLDLAR
ncbi:hypothetical protein [Deinococcus multiflagellatus]|uniref:Uncharacterized protein n=1 Tax=Deinococcus multiflagellatus TaxID=1656887 RepID=A0ABW1ZSP2_9DEIO|nr:hypothetical protein [Deinococcus multiflagellatus]MBZ9715438.1 hypothetical protein [Deinococcus multiflagellatus]